jgi:hypothetical protein
MRSLHYLWSTIRYWGLPAALTTAISQSFVRGLWKSTVSYCRQRHYAHFDIVTMRVMPQHTLSLPDIAKLRDKSSAKTLASLLRLRIQDKVLSIHVDEKPDDYFWRKL